MPEKPNAILLLDCPDQMGSGASGPNLISRHSGHIVHAAQHASGRSKIVFVGIGRGLGGFFVARAAPPSAEKPDPCP